MYYNKNKLETVESSLNLQKEFKAECNRFTVIAKKYLHNYKKIYLNLISKVVRKEYSTGGKLLYRGYYCPSPVYDIVTGNCNRGKILNKITSKSKLTHEYCFDNNDKLIIINYLYSDYIEILEYFNNIVIGITFSLNLNEIISVTECIYDSYYRIKSFIKADSCHNDCCIDHLEKEDYEYNHLGLYIAEIYDCLDSKNSPIINYQKYTFEHDNEGYLEQYQVEPSIFEDDVYKVLIKRKI